VLLLFSPVFSDSDPYIDLGAGADTDKEFRAHVYCGALKSVGFKHHLKVGLGGAWKHDQPAGLAEAYYFYWIFGCGGEIGIYEGSKWGYYVGPSVIFQIKNLYCARALYDPQNEKFLFCLSFLWGV
jgi:hypothetical protein